jgi:hypothetical protein
MNRRRLHDYADLGLAACLLITVPIAWGMVAALFLLIDWAFG